jgi:anti-anti-sigma regulatory factor
LTKVVNPGADNVFNFRDFRLALGLHPGKTRFSYKDRMFRIHRKANGGVVFALSGRLDAEHITELETLIDAEASGRRIILDLKDMILTGQDGIDFLIRCEASDIALVNCDPYVREWIARQRNGK